MSDLSLILAAPQIVLKTQVHANLIYLDLHQPHNWTIWTQCQIPKITLRWFCHLIHPELSVLQTSSKTSKFGDAENLAPLQFISSMNN